MSFGEDSQKELEVPISEEMETSTLNGSSGLLIGEKSQRKSRSTNEFEDKIGDLSTLNGPSGLLIGEKIDSPKEVPAKQLEEPPEPSWCEAAQQRLRESELQGKMHRKSSVYIPLEPLVESPDSSWGERAE